MSRKKRVLYAAVVLAGLLTAAEIILRLHDFSFYYNFGADILGMPLLDMHKLRRVQNRTVEHDPYLFWRFKPDQILTAHGIYKKPVTINSHGFRGPDFQARKSKSLFRVVCLGDSTTFGWSVGDQETFSYFLNERLGGSSEVLNLGVTGYTSFQGRMLMELYVKDWDPDVVVFAFGPNDRLPALRSDLEHFESRTWDIGPASMFLHRFQVYKLFRSGIIYVRNRTRGLSLDPKTYIPKLKRKVSMEEYENNVRSVKKLCDKINADLILVHVDFPSLPKDHVSREIEKRAGEQDARLSPDWAEWDGQVLHKEMSSELEVPYLDLRGRFSKALGKDNEWRFLMVDNGHPNAAGHRLIANELHQLIKATSAYQRYQAFKSP